MELTDREILNRLENGSLTIEPIDDYDLQIQPASVDVRLGNTFLKFNPGNTTSINPLEDNPDDYIEEVTVDPGDTFVVHPGDFVLGTTEEWVEIPEDLIGYVNGRSTLGRLAIVVHATAGLLDPGWKGNVTLEISNLGSVPVELTPGMRAAQLTFRDLTGEVERPYGADRGSKYQNQEGVQAARQDY